MCTKPLFNNYHVYKHHNHTLHSCLVRNMGQARQTSMIQNVERQGCVGEGLVQMYRSSATVTLETGNLPIFPENTWELVPSCPIHHSAES